MRTIDIINLKMNTSMKKILFAAVAALAITGCSQNEEFDAASQKAEINFTPVVNKSTRAAITDLAALKTSGFKVFAYNTGTDGTGALNKTIMGGVDVTFKSTWTYTDGPYYWPTGSKVGFFAYAPATSTAAAYAVTTPDSDTTPTITYTVPAVAAQEDFVVATLPKQDASDNVVLPFTHALCQVNFSVVGDDDLTYTVSEVKIMGVANTGKYNYTTWTEVSGTAGEYSYPLTSTPTTTNKIATNLDKEDGTGALMLLPQTFEEGSSAKIVVSYVVKDANNDIIYTATNKEVALAKTTAWTIAKKMRYTLTLTNGAKSISFGDPTVGGWDTEEDSETPSVPKN